MTLPTVSWNESSPAGSDNKADGDNRIREMKTQIREVIDVDHQFNSSGQDADNGKHTKVSLLEQADLGSGATGKPILGGQTVSGKPELVYTDEDDNDVQITSAGKVCGLGSGQPWRAGDLILSSNTTAPTGWTDVSTTYDNKFIRIGDDTPLTTTGGSDTLSGNTGSTTLTAAQSGLPAHTHTVTASNTTGGAGTGPQVWTSQSMVTSFTTDSSVAAAASEGHAHDLSSVSCVPAWFQTRLYKKS